LQLVFLPLGTVGSVSEEPATLLPVVPLWSFDEGVDAEPLLSFVVESPSDWLGLFASLPSSMADEPSNWLPVSLDCVASPSPDGEALLPSADPSRWLPLALDWVVEPSPDGTASLPSSMPVEPSVELSVWLPSSDPPGSSIGSSQGAEPDALLPSRLVEP